MDPGVEDAAASGLGHQCQGGTEQDQRRGDEDRQRGELHLPHVDFLAQIFRGAANHQPGDKHRQQHEQEHPVQARSNAAKHHFTNLHQPQRDHPAQRGEGVVHGIDRPAGGGGGDHGVQAASENAKAALFALHIAVAVGTQQHEVAVALPLRPHHQRGADRKDDRHGPEDRVPLAAIADRLAKSKAQRGGDQKDRQHLHGVSQGGRVLKRMG